MPGFQVGPLLRSRRRLPPGRSDVSGGLSADIMSGGWCCKLTVLGVLATLALLTTFVNLREFSIDQMSHPASRKLSKEVAEGAEQQFSSESEASSFALGKSKSRGSGSSSILEEVTAKSGSNQEEVMSKSSLDQSSGSPSCKGIENWELWGPATMAGDKNKQPSPEACCASCRKKCKTTASCVCDSWVYCGDKKECKEQYQECWLKKQQDELKPEVRLGSGKTPWTSGLIYPDGKGIVLMETSHGSIRIQLAPDMAPRTVDYVRSVLGLKFCSGCQFYRAEALGAGWSADGKRTQAPPGPPYALLQGSLQADGLPYEEIPKEGAIVAVRGTVCLIGGGPEFFISVGDHVEWETGHTVFGHVLPEDMQVVDALVGMPTRKDVWGETEVQVLESPVQFVLKRAVPVS